MGSVDEVLRALSIEIIPLGDRNITVLSVFIFLALLVAIVAFCVLAYRTYHEYLKNAFYETYEIKLDNAVRVSRRTDDGASRFVLVYPRWRYPNKDGSRDRRRKTNNILVGKSILEVGRFRVASTSPVQIIWLANALRKRGVSVERNSLEAKKYARAVRMRQTMFSYQTIESIISNYAESGNYAGFEEYCAQLYRAQGYKAVVTSRTGDGGFDIILYEGTVLSALVECKCFSQSHKVGRPHLQKLYGANVAYRAKKLIFITTSDFSAEAKEYARSPGVNMELVNGAKLLEMAGKAASTREAASLVMLDDWKLTREDLIGRYPPDYLPPNINMG